MHEPPSTLRVAVVGGGIAGLVAALHAAAVTGAGTVTVFDPRPLGGRARTDDRHGFTFGRGPRALYRGGVADRTLQALEVPVRSGGRPALAGAGAVIDGRARRFLLGGGAPVAATRALRLVLRRHGLDLEGRTVAEWIEARSIPAPVASWVEAMIRVATYADAPEVLPASVALAQARAANLRGVQYLDGGFGSIVDSLAASAQRAGVATCAVGVRGVRPLPGGGVELHLDDGRRICADSSVMCVGAPQRAASLLTVPPPGWARLGPPAEVACLELGVRRRPRFPFLLGIDVPTYLSQHGPPAMLAPPGHRVVHVVRYLRPGVASSSEAIHAELRRTALLAGLAADDIVEERFLARMTASTALPTTAHPSPGVRVDAAPGIFVAGDWVGPATLLLDAVVGSASSAGRLAGEHARARSATMAQR